jgi:hypothetical protein
LLDSAVARGLVVAGTRFAVGFRTPHVFPTSPKASLPMKIKFTFLALAVVALATSAAHADDKTLRLLTWGGYAPKDVIEQFTKETGYKVEVTTSNNE